MPKPKRKHLGKKVNTRIIAAKVLVAVSQQGHHLDSAIKVHLPADINRKDAAFVQELCYGSMRYWIRLEAIVNSCIQRPLKSKDADITALLILGLYQLVYMRVPDHAALAETVNAVAGIGKTWAKKLVNGVLRTLQRDYENKLSELEEYSYAYYNHPQWMIAKMQQQWPQQWLEIVEANDRHPPLIMRVNNARISTELCLTELAAVGLDAEAIEVVPTAIRLGKALDVKQIDLFTRGFLSVQDSAAQLAAPLLELKPQERVLDMCAAPGGKTGHMLECQPELQELIAVEVDPNRSERIVENLRRLKLDARVLSADATAVETWWDKRPFDKILLDVPCSASGVIRRHPDIKVLRTEDELNEILQLQQKILTAIWPLLRPGGLLLYVTCSIFQEENEQQIEHFLATNNDATVMDIESTCGIHRVPGLQILPGADDMDGFYFCRLKKICY